jgi:signal transduction histidine kinase
VRLATHVVDLLAFTVFVMLTDGPPTSPFFVYFVFSILCGTLRWGWRGTAWTAVVSLTAVMAVGLWSGYLLDDERLNRFIIRCVYLMVLAGMLGYLGAYEQQLRGEIGRLAAWPRAARGEFRDVVRGILEHAAQVFNAPRVLMVWEEPEEPWVNMASWSRDGFDWHREGPGRFEPLVAPEMAVGTFFCLDAGAARPRVVHAAPAGSFRRWRGTPVHAGVRARYGMQAVLSLPFGGELNEGRLFFLDKTRMNADDVLLARVVAQQVATRLDHCYLDQQLQHAAVMEERIRFARDLHDGLLQSLTGTALQLEMVGRLLRDDPEAALGRLEEVKRLIVAEQRNLRSYIRELKPAALLASKPSSLEATLRNLADRIERQWGLRVELRSGALPGCEAAGLAHDISHLVHEALVNAARHGAASGARVTIDEHGGHVTIVVADNGRGFPFRGRYGLGELQALAVGPLTLKERIAALGGSLDIESSEAGARLTIALPLASPVPA